MTQWAALSELLRNVALTFAAIVGAILAWRQLSPAALQAKSANAQAKLSSRGVPMLRSYSIAPLRDPNLEVRLAAIYVLRELAKDFPDFSNPVFELRQAYLRAGGIDYGDDDPPIDILEIGKVLRSRLGEADAET
jgi:hypothetical protein